MRLEVAAVRWRKARLGRRRRSRRKAVMGSEVGARLLLAVRREGFATGRVSGLAVAKPKRRALGGRTTGSAPVTQAVFLGRARTRLSSSSLAPQAPCTSRARTGSLRRRERGQGRMRAVRTTGSRPGSSYPTAG